MDQSYFGINGLEKYGYTNEANELAHKLMHNAEGVLDKGATIRENYQPITGKGLEAYNFSWSASHYLMLLLEDK
ncbi:Glucosidase YgjK [compost metagenome]